MRKVIENSNMKLWKRKRNKILKIETMNMNEDKTQKIKQKHLFRFRYSFVSVTIHVCLFGVCNVGCLPGHLIHMFVVVITRTVT